MTGRQLTLNNFFIFNDKYGREEGEEEEKVMYFYSLKSTPDNIMKTVGLSEAIIKFVETFNPSQPCEVLCTEKTKQYYYQPEENFWMVMTVNVPRKRGIEGVEYLGTEVQDSVCQAVLRQAYVMARLFIGPFNDLIEGDENSKDSTSVIKTKLQSFYNKYLQTLNLDNCDILDVFQGVLFLPLDKTTFLHVQCFINHVEATFSDVIDFSIFLYNEQLIWSGLEPEDLQVVFRYLVSNLLPSYLDSLTSVTISHPSSPRNVCGFVTGPKDLLNDFNCYTINKVPKVYLNRTQKTPERYQMVVYRVKNATLCLFVKCSVLLTLDIYKRLDEYLEPRMDKIAKEVAEYNTRQTAASALNDGSSRFVYFNRMNLATKSTIHLDNRKSGNVVVTKDILRILADINSEHWRMVQAGNATCETIVKTVDDYWVVGRLSNAREFYVVTEHKNANIVEINDEVKRLCDKQLKSIFFHV